jgi:hypothetical protein
MTFGLEVNQEDLGVGTYSVIDSQIVSKDESIIFFKGVHPDVKEYKTVLIPQGVRNTMEKEVRPTTVETNDYVAVSHSLSVPRTFNLDFQKLINRDPADVTRDSALAKTSDLEFFQGLVNSDNRVLNVAVEPNIVENTTGVLEAEYPTFEYYFAHGMMGTPSGRKVVIPLYVSDTTPVYEGKIAAPGYYSAMVNWYNPNTEKVKYYDSSDEEWKDSVNIGTVHSTDQSGIDQLIYLIYETDFVYQSIPLGVLTLPKYIEDYRSSTNFFEDVKNTNGKCLIFIGEDENDTSILIASGYSTLHLHNPYHGSLYDGRGCVIYHPGIDLSPAVVSTVHPYACTEICNVTDIQNSFEINKDYFNNFPGVSSEEQITYPYNGYGPEYWIVNYRKRITQVFGIPNYSTAIPERAFINITKYVTARLSFDILDLLAVALVEAGIAYDIDSNEYKFLQNYYTSIYRASSYIKENDTAINVYDDWVEYTDELVIDNIFQEENFNLLYYYVLQKESYTTDDQARAFELFFAGKEEDLSWVNNVSTYQEGSQSYYCLLLGR